MEASTSLRSSLLMMPSLFWSMIVKACMKVKRYFLPWCMCGGLLGRSGRRETIIRQQLSDLLRRPNYVSET